MEKLGHQRLTCLLVAWSTLLVQIFFIHAADCSQHNGCNSQKMVTIYIQGSERDIHKHSYSSTFSTQILKRKSRIPIKKRKVSLIKRKSLDQLPSKSIC
ncbi:hypothetical protein ACSBR2_032895 [Camellia fascicularis]